jgi:hypothetical protein
MHGELRLPFRRVAGQGLAESLAQQLDLFPVEALELLDQDSQPRVIR